MQQKIKALDGYRNECDRDYPYRLPNGACNNLKNPWWGSTYSPYKRLAQPDYDDFLNSPRTKATRIGLKLPNARLLAANVLAAKPKESELSAAFTYFGQFISHELMETPDDRKECFCDKLDTSCFNIPVLAAEKEPSFINQPCIPLRRNLNSKIANQCNFGQREQMTSRTHWLDNDSLYGESEKDFRRLRTGKNGLLKSSVLPDTKFEGLPIDNIEQCQKPGKSFGCFFAGDSKVEQSVMLTSLHTVI